MTASAILSLLLAAQPADMRPTLAAVVRALEDRGYDCTTRSPEDYVRWCHLTLYPMPSVSIALSCDGRLVNGLELSLTPVGDAAILKPPEGVREAIETPTLEIPAEAANWLDECVASTASGSERPERIRLDHFRADCDGTLQGPHVSMTFLKNDGTRFIDQKCPIPHQADEK
jgi:hypothetical protein